MNPPSFRPDPDPDDQALDALLDSYRVAPASASLQARIRRQTRPNLRQSILAVLQDLGGWRVLAPAMAFSLCLGLIVPMFAATRSVVTDATSESLTFWELGQLSENTEFAQ